MSVSGGDDGSRRVSMDTAQVTAVSAYYRRSALVLSAVADDLATHDFGAWARDSGTSGQDSVTFGPSAAVYARMSSTLTRRLRVQAAAAAALAGSLRNSALAMADGDVDAAVEIARALPAAGTDVR
ncbi:hypothetical protein [Gordonia lacunae]|uniref:ESX-1 secretion-associated protein n=1 Tax=Gordonia lacunae TaxID=417102 RepID=A0A243QA91_9ACTN|nr:hypothetical protein [Gordonia lacunae]OUC78507.1 hypothetical protein CA982_12075 [Gordonia lacunae]